jgi:hypothetical protein
VVIGDTIKKLNIKSIFAKLLLKLQEDRLVPLSPVHTCFIEVYMIFLHLFENLDYYLEVYHLFLRLELFQSFQELEIEAKFM